jgi:hypothetical protein
MTTEQWKLKSFTYFTVTCSHCLWEPTELAKGAEQAVEQWTSWGWKLTEHGPICPYCQTETDQPNQMLGVKEPPTPEDFAQAAQQLLSFEEASK